MTVTDSRQTGTSIYNSSRVKQTTGRRRRLDTPVNLQGGIGWTPWAWHPMHGTWSWVVMPPLAMAHKVTATGHAAARTMAEHTQPPAWFGFSEGWGSSFPYGAHQPALISDGLQSSFPTTQTRSAHHRRHGKERQRRKVFLEDGAGEARGSRAGSRVGWQGWRRRRECQQPGRRGWKG